MSENPEIKKNPDQDAWRADAIKTLADLSHTLRNPFSTIQSYLNILEMDEYNYTPEALQNITQILQETVEKSFKLIDEKIADLKNNLK